MEAKEGRKVHSILWYLRKNRKEKVRREDEPYKKSKSDDAVSEMKRYNLSSLTIDAVQGLDDSGLDQTSKKEEEMEIFEEELLANKNVVKGQFRRPSTARKPVDSEIFTQSGYIPIRERVTIPQRLSMSLSDVNSYSPIHIWEDTVPYADLTTTEKLDSLTQIFGELHSKAQLRKLLDSKKGNLEDTIDTLLSDPQLLNQRLRTSRDLLSTWSRTEKWQENAKDALKRRMETFRPISAEKCRSLLESQEVRRSVESFDEKTVGYIYSNTKDDAAIVAMLKSTGLLKFYPKFKSEMISFDVFQKMSEEDMER